MSYTPKTTGTINVDAEVSSQGTPSRQDMADDYGRMMGTRTKTSLTPAEGGSDLSIPKNNSGNESMYDIVPPARGR